MSRPENSLGNALRGWRARITTEDVGLPATGRRRTAGLRREELAHLAGISTDYLLRLEQGRSQRPSRDVVASLARALRLSTDETCHLHLVAGLRPPTPPTIPHQMPPGVQRLVSRWGNIPVGVFSASWTLLTWTSMWVALLGDPALRSPEERNLVRAVFNEPSDTGRPLFPVEQSTPEFKAALVVDLRITHEAYPRDEGFRMLIDEVMGNSEEFRELWSAPALGSRLGGHKRLRHPLVGEIRLDNDVLKVPDHDVRIVTYTAEPGSSDEEKLEYVRIAATRTTLPLSSG
ncbi:MULTISPECIES: helix-turn-helix transcriptional regulator [Streptomyces violaceusniger group]|uniref:Helix-turn-helix transcriptional regulator n=2 Tax=Streptomyces antimycoticus TaxID=68175 RepID=A0ABD5J129_9ACTN|nr:helix-turn-helix transcriptional regulator [Streptomyces violaceusniger]MEE4582080.1 helix-turn-helix transcriptional regulator [Streptomyces sp. DSM 41602]